MDGNLIKRKVVEMLSDDNEEDVSSVSPSSPETNNARQKKGKDLSKPSKNRKIGEDNAVQTKKRGRPSNKKKASDDEFEEESSDSNEILNPTDRSRRRASATITDDKIPTPTRKERAFESSSSSKSTQKPLSRKSIQKPLSRSNSPQFRFADTTSTPHITRVSDQSIESSLTEIKSLLKQQKKTINLQSQKFDDLTVKVDRLKKHLGA